VFTLAGVLHDLSCNSFTLACAVSCAEEGLIVAADAAIAAAGEVEEDITCNAGSNEEEEHLCSSNSSSSSPKQYSPHHRSDRRLATRKDFLCAAPAVAIGTHLGSHRTFYDTTDDVANFRKELEDENYMLETGLVERVVGSSAGCEKL
jgi:hypothetical protein